ncbi:phosphoesterase [Capnocytophaga stomatis]|uniref:metallophosphoesterase family protein n=1 Tax=Capnocytophaga stomatis TaxID=1848904 RepID=UPI001951DB65|nr:metallophosphoesterase family protein [Capnocytophaga stomatis]GIJ97797.1 phosphoesterase [Capnocytophaga stomatis]GIM48741.1 phosphoesterase [Capnocytophaga stomatis]
MKILLLSDTHSYIDDKILNYAQQVDEIWHCGDFGSFEVVEALEKIKPVRGVYGNIDGAEIRSKFPEVNRFCCEGVEVLMIHIGGYPDKYTSLAKKEIISKTPKIFISGHSHILKIMYDRKFQLLHLNPGAVGKHGWQTVRTMIRFEIDGGEIKNVEVIEFER